MDILNFKYKKHFFIVLNVVMIILSYFLTVDAFAKVDDWKYSPKSHTNINWSEYTDYLIPVGFIIGVLFLISYLVISIWLITKGKPIIENGIKKRNPKRVVGLIHLFGFIGAAGFLFLAVSVSINSGIFMLTVFLLWVIYIIWATIYSVKNRIKTAIISIITISVFVGAFIIAAIFIAAIPKFITSKAESVQSYKLFDEAGNLGFSTGGAKDINNFRENIEDNYLPVLTDITYEGLFYDYYFDTGEKEVTKKLFCPSYSYAISKDPFSKEDEYYLSVGLNSGIKESDFKRKKLNLVIVMDISGSMSSPFDTYYYDQFGRTAPTKDTEKDTDYQKSKMEVARESVVALLNHLKPDERFGMILFDNAAYLGKSLSLIGDTDMDAIKKHILEIQPRGGTYFEAGYKDGTKLFDKFINADQSEYENRIIFITDAMPNIGQIGEEGLLELTKKNADNKIYTTFIGVGVDFNTELIEYITKIRGANYYSVHSSKEFKERMDDEFEYMVTPLVFNLNLSLNAEGYKIEKVYGSPEANEATGEIMKVNTLFPSKKKDEETKGGIVILKLKKISQNTDLKIKVSYEDRLGKVDTNEVDVILKEKTPDFYENTGIRKAILLSRYANLMKNWINDERKSDTKGLPIKPAVNRIEGIVIPPDFAEPQLGKWERQSIPLKVSQEYKGLIKEFSTYFEKEMNSIGDNTLSKELTVLNKLSEK